MKIKLHDSGNKLLLVGDNPFHNISHLSQERARGRGDATLSPERCADLVITSIENGANGFTFSVSDLTLEILNIITEKQKIEQIKLYPLLPYAFDYVRKATSIGISGLFKDFSKEIVLSRNFNAIFSGAKGVLKRDASSLFNAYLSYELSRIYSATNKKADVSSIVMHEVITDLALSLNLDWFFKSYIQYVKKLKIKPGFNTRNFVYLVDKFLEWDIVFDDLVIEAPFNKIGFQMIPSMESWENALSKISKADIIAISILAAGYLKPPEAIDYIASLPNIKGVAVGVSKKHHAHEMFNLLNHTFGHL